jgi:hypothetical protein
MKVSMSWKVWIVDGTSPIFVRRFWVCKRSERSRASAVASTDLTIVDGDGVDVSRGAPRGR